VYFLLRACLIMCVVRGCVLLDKKKVAWGWVSFCARRKKPEASHSVLAASKAPTKAESVGQSSARRGQAGGRSAARRPLAGLPKHKRVTTLVQRQFSKHNATDERQKFVAVLAQENAIMMNFHLALRVCLLRCFRNG